LVLFLGWRTGRPKSSEYPVKSCADVSYADGESLFAG